MRKLSSGRGWGCRQDGSAALILVLVVSMIAFFFVIGPVFFKSLEAFDQVEVRDEAYMDEIATKLADWYAQNASTIDANPTYTIAPATLWSAINVVPKASLEIGISDRLTGSQVRFRRIFVWLRRATPDATSFNPATGTFAPDVGVSWRVIDGEGIEGRLLDRTIQRMQALASMLQRRFQAKFESDPLRSLSVNHFRPVSGTCTTVPDDIPCIDGYTPVATAANWVNLLSQDASAFSTAWGQQFLVSNLADSNTTTPPFTMAIRADLPWGASIVVNAVQPLN